MGTHHLDRQLDVKRIIAFTTTAMIFFVGVQKTRSIEHEEVDIIGYDFYCSSHGNLQMYKHKDDEYTKTIVTFCWRYNDKLFNQLDPVPFNHMELPHDDYGWLFIYKIIIRF